MARFCKRCGVWLEETDFPRNRSRPDGLGLVCKPCHRTYVRKHYLENRPYYLAKARRQNQQRLEAARAALRELKARPCAGCLQSYPYWIMDFDHVNADKLFNMGRMSRKYSLQKVLEEARKCEVVCANCHRDRTHRRRLALLQAAEGSGPVATAPK